MTSTSWVILIAIMFTYCTKIHSLKLSNFCSNKNRRLSALRMAKVEKLEPVRVRFAPSPTGLLHVGGARTALFNWLLARKTNGKFIIRVEDTDEARSTRESEKSILADLKWLTLNWDEGPELENEGPYGPYRQSERKDIYKAAAEKLIEKGVAYRCFCSEEELEEKRLQSEAKGEDAKYDGTWRDADPEEVQRRVANGEPYTIRFRVPDNKIVFIDDCVRGRVTWDASASLGDFIILRSSGMPVYNFCVSVDDASMKITHVVRAEEHLSNTLRQMLILEALDYKPPTYAHCSLILGSDRSKLSKRHGATSVQQFSQQGFIPEAMMNYLANLGWNDGTPKEIYSPEELIAAFDLNRIVKSSAVFDMDKLKWINSQHLRAMPFAKMKEIVLSVLRSPSSFSSEPLLDPSLPSDTATLPGFEPFLDAASKIAQRDMELTIDATPLVGNCLQYPMEKTLQSDSHVLEVLQQSESLQAIAKALVADFEAGKLPTGKEGGAFADAWKAYVKQLGVSVGLKGKNLFHPLRLCLTGRMSGPDVGDQIR